MQVVIVTKIRAEAIRLTSNVKEQCLSILLTGDVTEVLTQQLMSYVDWFNYSSRRYLCYALYFSKLLKRVHTQQINNCFKLAVFRRYCSNYTAKAATFSLQTHIALGK